MRKYKGNILLIVMFILFLTSLLGLLIVKYIQNMVDYSTEFFRYYKSYYVSYAGVELSLVKINNHGFGFEDSVLSGSDTIKKNFKYCGGNRCFFTSRIKNLSNVISNEKKSFELVDCVSGSYFNLDKGQGIILPLFKDYNIGEGTLSGTNYRNISQTDFSNISLNFKQSSNKYFTIGVADLENSSRNILEKNLSGDPIVLQLNGSEFNGFYNDTLRSFLVIGNTENTTSLEKLCVKSPISALPSNYMVVESVGNYFDKYVSIDAVKLKVIPDYLIYNIIGN